jgi:hypothetical protein
MPNIYIRTKTDLSTRKNYREVVDGQQRLTAIQEFAGGRLTLGIEAKEYKGYKYEDLDDEKKRTFLEYKIGVVQLFNASDEEVLDTFHRINAYGLNLNKQELRHGRWQGAFRNAVIDASKRWIMLWTVHKIVGIRDQVRMGDDELMAQMFGLVLEGVKDGGQPYIDKLYKTYDEGLPMGVVQKVDRTIEYILKNLPEIMETSLSRAPHFLMLFAAVAHALHEIPQGDMKDAMPKRDSTALSDLDVAKANLGLLADVLHMNDNEVPERFFPFKLASAGTTQRIKSRSVRFSMMYKALLPKPL